MSADDINSIISLFGTILLMLGAGVVGFAIVHRIEHDTKKDIEEIKRAKTEMDYFLSKLEREKKIESVLNKIDANQSDRQGAVCLLKEEPNDNNDSVTWDELERALTQYIPGEYHAEDK